MNDKLKIMAFQCDQVLKAAASLRVDFDTNVIDKKGDLSQNQYDKVDQLKREIESLEKLYMDYTIQRDGF